MNTIDMNADPMSSGTALLRECLSLWERYTTDPPVGMVRELDRARRALDRPGDRTVSELVAVAHHIEHLHDDGPGTPGEAMTSDEWHVYRAGLAYAGRLIMGDQPGSESMDAVLRHATP